MILPLKSEMEHGTLNHKAPKSLKFHPPSAVIFCCPGSNHFCTVQVDAGGIHAQPLNKCPAHIKTSKTTFNSRLKSNQFDLNEYSL